MLDLEVRRRGKVVSKFCAEADPPKSPHEFRQLLLDAVRRDGRDESQIAEYEMDIRYFSDRSLVTTFVARTGLISPWTDLSPKQNPKPCATGCCTPPLRIVHGQRKRKIRIPETWPWAPQLQTCFHTALALPPPT